MPNTPPRRPPRLEQIFERYKSPLYFVTFCTQDRSQILACDEVHQALRLYGERGAQEKHVALGRYVIMPDHIHVFVQGHENMRLDLWVRGLKRTISDSLKNQGKPSIWQQGFFDHLVRSAESYEQKWQYVMQNPVRAGLATNPNLWPYQGEIISLAWRKQM